MKKIITCTINIYRNYIAPHKLPSCRFYPSCSEYAIEAVEKKGVIKGSILSIGRIFRCSPLSRGGYDPVK